MLIALRLPQRGKTSVLRMRSSSSQERFFGLEYFSMNSLAIHSTVGDFRSSRSSRNGSSPSAAMPMIAAAFSRASLRPSFGACLPYSPIFLTFFVGSPLTR
ncbi:hypothetical protein D3C87_1760320 [compost metagenome]